MKITIERERWLRGEGSEDSALLRGSDRKMCCLGFLALACGFSEDEILNSCSPIELRFDRWPAGTIAVDGVTLKDSEVIHRLMDTNDSIAPDIEVEREAVITELMAGLGVEVEFV